MPREPYSKATDRFLPESGHGHLRGIVPLNEVDYLRAKRHFLIIVAICTTIAISCAPSDKKTPPTVQKIDHNKIIDMVHKGHHHVTLVNAWATWCEPCREEMPGLVRLRKEYGDKDVNIILVSTDDPATADTLVPRVLGKLGVDFPTYIDDDSTDESFITGMNPDWSGALPATFLYNNEGIMVKMLVGGTPYPTFEKEVLQVLASEH